MCTYWNKVSLRRSTTKNNKRIDSIGIGLASPEEIRRWGERRLPNGTLVGKVDKDHTVDYESLKPIEGGLFCERIFGPVEDFYCSCERRGEKNEKFCPDCEVEFTKSRVRRTRMGYIPLAVPVAHVWYLRGRPSYIANLIGKSRNTVDKLAYGETLCESFVGNTSTNYLKHGLEHLVESKKCRILNFDSSTFSPKGTRSTFNPDAKKTVSEDFQKEADAEVSFNQRLSSDSRWRFSYEKLLDYKFALGTCSATAGFFLKNRQPENHRVDEKSVESRFVPASIKLHSNPARSLPLPGHVEHGKISLARNSSAFLKTPELNFYGAPSAHFSAEGVNGNSSNGTSTTQQLEPSSKPKPIHPLHFKCTTSGVNAVESSLLNQRFNTTKSRQVHTLSEFYSGSRSIFIEQVGITSPFLQDFIPVRENVSWINPTGYLKNEIDKKSTKKISHNQRNFQRNDSQSFFSVVEDLMHKKKAAFSKNTFVCFKKSNQCISSNKYPYKVEKDSLSDGLLYLEKEKASCAPTAVESKPVPFLHQNAPTTVIPKQAKVQRVDADSLSDVSKNTLQEKYNKFHTLPIFSTFIYKEWSHRFSFLEYFIWSARENDLALPFYIRQGTFYMARINSMNLIRNQIGLEKRAKEFLFGFNNCTRNISWSQRQLGPSTLEKSSKPKLQPFAILQDSFNDSKPYANPSHLLCCWKDSSYTSGVNAKKDGKKLINTSTPKPGVQSEDPVPSLHQSARFVAKTAKGSINGVFSDKKKVKEYMDRLCTKVHSNGSKNDAINEKRKYKSHIFSPRSINESGHVLELRDKRVSLLLSIAPSLESNSTAERLSTPTIEQNSTPASLMLLEESTSLKSEILKAPYQEKSSSVFRKIEKFFGWGSSLSSEKIAMTNWLDFSGSAFIPEQGLPGRGLPGIHNSGKNVRRKSKNSIDQFLYSTRSNIKIQKAETTFDVNEIQINLDSPVESKKREIDKKESSSLASGNFQQLSNNQRESANTRWQESSFMWGKVDDTQQFPRLAELLHFTGGTALRHLLSRFHLVLLGKFLRHELKNLELKVNFLLALKMLTYSQGLLLGKLAKRRSKQIRRLKLLELFQSKKSNPEWMILSVLPILPPDLRPILRVNDDFVVASDLNRLYQTVLRRNNTIHERLDDPLPCPESGLFRQRSLQKAVDGLLENGKGGGTPLCASKRRPLVSLSHVLKGKKGLFRQHLLGKRVDYSGRSVIVVGPKLNLHECGLPKEMALELFQPFLIHRLKIKGLATSNTAARRMIQQEDPIIWHTVKQLVYEHPVLLNRAPTLHRLGIQAFQPRLVSGRAILLHPLVCNGFNADFDGDQMAVHVPLSFQARAEAWKIMWSKNNLLSPATGQPILVPSQDMVLGCYYLSVLVPRVSKLSPHALFFDNAKAMSPEVEKYNNEVLSSYTRQDQTGFVNESNLGHLNNLPRYLKERKVENSVDSKGFLRNTEMDTFSESLKKKVHVLLSPAEIFSQQLSFSAKTVLFKTPKVTTLLRTPSDFTIFKTSSKRVDQTSTATALAELITPKSYLPIHPPGFFKKTQHLGFLTDANLLQKMASVCKITSILQRESKGFFDSFLEDRGESSCSTFGKSSLISKKSTLGVDGFNALKKVDHQAERMETSNYKNHPKKDDLIPPYTSGVNAVESSLLNQRFNTPKQALYTRGVQAKAREVHNLFNSTYHLKRGHYFSRLQDTLIAYSQGRLQTHTPFWVRLEYSVTDENKDTTLLDENSVSPFLETAIVTTSKNKHILSRSDKIEVVSSLLQPRYGCSQELCRTFFQKDQHKIVIEANETLEAPLELRLGADANLVKILTTFQNHYTSQATILDQYKEKSIRYMRTTAGRVVINETLFHF